MSIATSGGPHLLTGGQLAELPDDGLRHELIEGELTTMPPAGERHGSIAGRIAAYVGHYVLVTGLGRITGAETGYLLGGNPDTVRAPDFAFTSTDRLAGPPDRTFSSILPDLVVEVASPSDRLAEVTRKALMWLDAGVRLVWVDEPETEVVIVHRPGDAVTLLRGADTTLSGEDVVPGFAVHLHEIFG